MVNGNRGSEVAHTLDEAVETLKRLREKLEKLPHNAKLSDMKCIQGVFERTVAHVWAGTDAERSSKINGSLAVAFFKPDKLVAKIGINEIDAYVDHLIKEGNADSTINRKLSALSTMLKVALDRGIIQSLPKIPRRKEREGRIRFLQPGRSGERSEEEQLLSHFEHLGKFDHKEAAIILIDTGFRCSELWGVEAQHVDQRQRTITLWKTKNKKARTIPMTERAFQIIERRCKEHPQGKLFPGSSNDWMRLGWDRVRAIMGKEDDKEFVPHMLRHTCCSRLVQRGVPLIHVQNWMGHKNIQTTMRYAHLAPHDLFSLAQVLEGGADIRWQNSAITS
jgi:integrase